MKSDCGGTESQNLVEESNESRLSTCDAVHLSAALHSYLFLRLSVEKLVLLLCPLSDP